MWNIIQNIFVWGSLIFAIYFFVRIVGKVLKDKAQIKDWLYLFGLTIYILGFIGLKIFCNELFEEIASVIFICAVIIATQIQKYEDRKSGKRWWTR